MFGDKRPFLEGEIIIEDTLGNRRVEITVSREEAYALAYNATKNKSRKASRGGLKARVIHPLTARPVVVVG